jgi:PAS domain S-box-containing protein
MCMQTKFGQIMTFQHSTSAFQNHLGDVQFNFDELFFSCTDERGVITAGNDVFQRISGFEWDELLGAPHKTVRHPDMPKGMFHIFWDRIQKGLPTGAYVLNQCKDGKAYWVFAIISPFDGGYLSVRLKPSSAVFDTSRELYKAVLEKERDGLSASESAAFLMDKLKELGFDDYSCATQINCQWHLK